MALPTASQALSDPSAALVTAPVALADWLVVTPVALCIGVGALLMMLRHSIRLHAPLAIAALMALVIVDAALLVKVMRDGPLTMVMGRWLPPFGIAFTADLTGVLLALVSALVALAGAIHAATSIDAGERRYGFYPFLLLLMAGVSGSFLTGDIFNLYVWFEVLLISSFGLLVLGPERAQIDGALKYAVLNLIATTLFLISVGYLYAAFGTLNMADIAAKAAELRGTAPLMTLSALFLLAFAMKAAAFPVNFWLPASYHTPRIVVSALFGGLLTKAGIYALLRVMVMLFPVERSALSPVIAACAVLTMLLGAMGALAMNDMRRIPGYAVISGIGAMLAGIAMGTPAAVAGTVLYALNSMVAMTVLYLVMGEAIRIGGAARLESAGALMKRAPWFSALALVVLFAACGLPPFSGFWPKVQLLRASVDNGSWWLAGGLLASGLMLTIALMRLFLLAFWRPQPQAEAPPPVPSGKDTRMVAIVLLAVPLVWFGLFPQPLLELAGEAAATLTEPPAYMHSVFPQVRIP